MKQRRNTGQKHIFGGKIGDSGANEWQKQKEKPPYLFTGNKKSGYQMLKIDIILQVSLPRSTQHPSRRESYRAEIYPALWHAAQHTRNGYRTSC